VEAQPQPAASNGTIADDIALVVIALACMLVAAAVLVPQLTGLV
jgi:hypothetical protein